MNVARSMKNSLLKVVFLVVMFLTTLLDVSAQTNNTQVNPNGYNTFYYPNGRISSEGLMKNGKPDGYWKTYYVTGVMKSEGNRINTLLDSLWAFYTETGDTLEIINYKLGKKSGYYYSYATATETNNVSVRYLQLKELYLDDKREGIAYYYYPDEKIKQQISYRNGKKQGVAKDFDHNGMVITLYEYHNDYMISREYINRLDKEGRKTGTWKTFFPDGKVNEELFYKDGQLHGNTKIYSERGTLVNERNYQEGRLVEEGIQLKVEAIELISYYNDGVTLKRKGIYLDSIAIGKHVFYNSEGNPEKAVFYSENGAKASEGSVDAQERRIGVWNNYYDNGRLRSKGNFQNDRQTGLWEFYFPTEKKEQTGNFQNGVMEGEWKWYYPDGNILREEIYVRGRPNGSSVEYSDSGKVVFKGNYLDGEPDGLWELMIGDVYETGDYEQGLKNGVWKTYFRNGKLYHKGNFIQGNPDGKHEFYYPDGTLKEEQYYVMGRRDKNWKKYYENGTLFLTITYRNDEETRINGIRIEDIKK